MIGPGFSQCSRNLYACEEDERGEARRGEEGRGGARRGEEESEEERDRGGN